MGSGRNINLQDLVLRLKYHKYYSPENQGKKFFLKKLQ